MRLFSPRLRTPPAFLPYTRARFADPLNFFARPFLLSSQSSGQARAAATRLTSVLARIELQHGTWPELLPWLWNLSATPNAAHREVALQTIFMLLDTLVVTPSKPGGSIANHIPQLLELFSKTLADPESLGVRVWTVRALGKLSEFIEQSETAEIVSLLGWKDRVQS